MVALRPDGRPGPSWALGRDPLTCGREAGELRLPEDPTVSPSHARLEPRPDATYAVDLGSLNGTFVRLRAPRSLAPGDEIRLGRQLLRVEPLPRPRPALPGGRPWGSTDPATARGWCSSSRAAALGEVIPLRAGREPIGRETGEVCFPGDRYVSARHARIDVGERGGDPHRPGQLQRDLRPRSAEPTDRLGAGDQLLLGTASSSASST